MRWSPTIALVAVVAGLLLIAPGARSAELLQDGGFEAGGGAWVQRDNHDILSVCGRAVPGCRALPSSASAHTGSWWTWFGGMHVNLLTGPQSSSVEQTVAATGGTPLTLSFWLWFGQTTENATLHVLLDNQVLFAVRGNDARYGQGYAPVVVPVHGSLVTGGPQTLRFQFDAAPPPLIFSFYHAINVDDISLQAPDIDLGVGLASAPTTVVQGATFATTISAGNGGPQGAGDVWVEYPLPAGATLVGLSGDASCAATETAPGHVMHCNFGAMPGGAAKAVTATFRADAVGPITQHATVAPRTGDANGGNHAARATVTVVPPATPPVDPPEKKAPPTCTPPRKFTVPLRKGTKGTVLMIGKHATARAKILSARLTGPKKFKTQKLRHTKSRVTVDLRKLAAGRYTVRARVRVSSKKTLNVTRTYTACGAPKTASKSTKKTTKKKTSTKATKSPKTTSTKKAKSTTKK